MSRAKVVKCEHGFIHSAHIYTQGDAKSETEALVWVAEGTRTGDTIEDMDVDEARPILFNCPKDCAK